MNTLATSREEILQKARDIALTKGMEALNIRGVAAACGIAVGTVYHYFPDKAALVIAVIGQIWQEIFAPVMQGGPWTAFLPMVRAVGDCVAQGAEKYPGFFTQHALVVKNDRRGQEAMQDAFAHMRAMLTDALLRDQLYGGLEWRPPVTPQALAELVLDFYRMEVLLGRSRSALLEALLRDALEARRKG